MCISRSPVTTAAAACRIGWRSIIRAGFQDLAVLDIAPTYDYWEKLNRLSALKIYHLGVSRRSHIRCRRR